MSSISYSLPIRASFQREAAVEILNLLPTALFPKRDGPLRQTALLWIRSQEKEARKAIVQIELDGSPEESVETVLKFGENKVELGIPDIASPTPIRVYVRSDDASMEAAWEGTWRPQRKWKVYLVKSSHYDLGYDGRFDVMQNDAAEYIDLAKRLCTDRDQHHEWHYHLEHMRFIRAYEAERSEVALRDLVTRYLKKGKMTLLGNPGGPHFHWMDYEQLARACYPARREMKDRFDLDVPTVSVVDNPSASWPSYQLFAQAGFKYLLRFGQGFRGPGDLRSLGAPAIAWVQGPNGKNRILCSFHDSYAQECWLGDGGTYGANLVEEAAFRLSERLLRIEAGESGSYPYDALIIPNYVDWEVPHENERALARWHKDYHYPELHWDDASQALSHIEQHYAEQIPVITGDTNNNSGDYSSIDPRSQGIKRHTTRLLAFAEGVNALASGMDGTHAYPGKKLNQQYIDLVEYDEHCWPTMLEATDVNIFNTCVAKVHNVERVAERVQEMLLPSLRLLGGKGGRSASFEISVWNPLAHSRTDLVEWEPPADFSAGQLIDSQSGKKIPFQRVGSGIIQFVAEGVPAYGYRRFRFMPSPSGTSKEHGLFEVDEDAEIISLKSRWYRLTFDKRKGKVVSLYSVSLQREMLDPKSEYGLNDWLRCGAAPCSYDPSPKDLEISQIGGVTARVVDIGPVSAVLEAHVFDKALGVEFTTRYSLYDSLDHVDIVNDVERADFLHTPATLRYRENIFISFPFEIPDFGFRVEYGPGVLDPAIDFFASNTDFVVANRWVDVSGGGYGVTFVPHEAPTVHLGQINYNQFNSQFRASTSHLYSYAWSNRMSGLITLCPEDFKARLSYSIRAHAGDWREGGASSFGWRQASPLIAIPVSGSDQENHEEAPSFLSVDNQHVQVTVLKRAERPGEGYVVRIVETGGLDHAAVSIIFGMGPIKRAFKCDGVENDKEELSVKGDQIALPIGKFDLVTIRICVGDIPQDEVGKIEVRPSGDAAIDLTWKTIGSAQNGIRPGFNLFRSEDPDAPPTLHTLIGYAEETAYRDTGLKPGTHYFYRIASATRHNLQGRVSPPVSAWTTLENRTPPSPVADLGVVPIDRDRLAVYWRRSSEPDIARYEVHRSEEQDFHINDETRIETVRPDRYEYLVYYDERVKAGETWYYRILPVDFAGNIQVESTCVRGRTPTMERFPARRYAS